MSKSIKIVFTASVLLNVLLIGILTGMAAQKYAERKERLTQMTHEMSPEGRHVVARTMQKAFRDGQGQMREMRRMKKQIRDILTEEEFDAQAFEEASRKMQSMMEAMGEKRINVTKDMAEDLSQEDRAVLAERFSKGFRGANPDEETRGRVHRFLKNFESRRLERSHRSAEDGPDLPDEMPPQP
ncbi:MAG: periplasmic heavy metal sensor [Alphaproteobacteria bacterium]